MLPPFDPDAFARDSEVKLHSVPPVTGETTTEAARRLLADGEPEEALFLLARLLEQMPLDTEARALSAECSAALERDCWSLIGPPGGVLEIMVAPAELKGFALDNVSGFLLPSSTARPTWRPCWTSPDCRSCSRCVTSAVS